MKQQYSFIWLVVIVGLIALGVFGYSRWQVARFNKLVEDFPRGTEIAEQIQKARATLREDPKNFESRFSLAFAKQTVGDYQGALKEYRRALTLSPENTLVMNNMAEIYKRLKEFTKAEELYQRMIAIAPGEVATYLNLADLYRYALGQPEAIEPLLTEAIPVVVGPRTDIYSYLAVYFRDSGNKEKAIEYFNLLLETDPNNEIARQELEKLQSS